MKVVAILQARTSSSRLPNKVLLPILGKPMIEHQIDRMSFCKNIDQLVVATSNDKSDDTIENLCNKLGISCFRGDLHDVLDRFYQAAKLLKPDHIVRLTGDCPLIDPKVIDAVITKHLDDRADYTSNCCPPTYPDGLDVEVLRFSVLKESWEKAVLPSNREHVTLYVREKDNNYQLSNYIGDVDLSEMRWTVDEPKDLEFVTKVYEELYHINNNFNTADILELLEDNDDISFINSAIQRNEGLLKSLHQDKLLNKGKK